MKFRQNFDPEFRQAESWEVRWEGSDKGLICSWLRGIQKAKEDPVLAAQCARGELPSLPWIGGGKAIKIGKRTGSLNYLAMWQGLRGADLDIDTDQDLVITCTLTGMVATFTGDAAAIWKATSSESS
ncbi:hypothetical protein [Variovorax sp.]|jgi:hypothetical protein|uniref:hypothetical protein n=1 Tax=Variovorax sp. TaxID=1871043 RepID=UPI004037B234